MSPGAWAPVGALHGQWPDKLSFNNSCHERYQAKLTCCARNRIVGTQACSQAWRWCNLARLREKWLCTASLLPHHLQGEQWDSGVVCETKRHIKDQPVRHLLPQMEVLYRKICYSVFQLFLLSLIFSESVQHKNLHKHLNIYFSLIVTVVIVSLLRGLCVWCLQFFILLFILMMAELSVACLLLLYEHTVSWLCMCIPHLYKNSNCVWQNSINA